MKKILIIDQNDFSRIQLKDSLNSEYFIIDAKNEKDAIAFAKTHRPNLIVLDMETLNKDSAPVCQKLKETKETKNAPLILLHTDEQREDIAKGLHSGADDYITKPFNANDLLARIEIHLRTKDYYADLRKKDLLMLLELTETISVTRNPKRILSIIVERIVETIEVSRCSIIGINDFGELLVLASSDLPKNTEVKINLEKYPEIEEAFSTQRPVIVRDARNNPLMAAVKANIKDLTDNSIFVVPIVKKQNVIGTFFLRTASSLTDGITDKIFKLCQIVTSISGNALENAMLFESMEANKRLLEDLSTRDGLTQLYNHQHYHTRLEEEFSRAKRYGLPLSCVFFDIDDFKKINDRFGHLTGDVVLRQLSRAIRPALRKSDTAARYGGEEFAICLPNTDPEAANQFAERIQTIVRSLSIQQLKGESVTVSIGISTHLNNMASYKDLLQAADMAMYQAKRSGKNRICYAERKRRKSDYLNPMEARK